MKMKGKTMTDKDKKARSAVWEARYRKKHPDSGRNGQLKYLYGITLKQHKQMYADQNGNCACCGQPVPYDKTCTDHSHETGKVRGLLCYRCNYGMGFIDDIVFMQRALEYVK